MLCRLVSGLGAAMSPPLRAMSSMPSMSLFQRMAQKGLRFFSSSAASSSKSADTAMDDLIVIGGGPGGYVASIKAAQLGLKVSCIEKRGSLGGTCLNVGCIPSKALLHSSHLYEMAQKGMKKYGITAGNVSFDLSQVMKQKEGAVTSLTKGIEHLFKKNNVNYVKGSAKFVGPKEVEVVGLDGSVTRHHAKNIIIATGSHPIVLSGVTIDEEKVVSSAGALSLPKVPKKMIVIGAGVIGLELGSVWRRFGSQVTFVEFVDKAGFFLDDEIGAQYTKLLQRQGLKFNLGTKVVGVDTSGPAVKVETENVKTGKRETLEADVVLMSVGRRANVDGLGAAEVGIEMNHYQKIIVNDHWETNLKGVYAIGDVIAGPMLAHKAEEEGIACVEHIVGKTGHVNYDCIPGVIYTHPEVAWVGKTEQQLKQEGVDYKVGKFLMQANSRARAILEADGMVKVLTDAKTDRILGMHILGGDASEQIAECVLAMEYDASSEDVARTCHAHPTLSEAVKEACLAAHFKPIHM